MNTIDQDGPAACRWLVLLGWGLLVGCGPVAPSATQQTNDEGARYLLQEEPDDPVGVAAAFAQLASEGDSSELTLVGRIPRQVSPGVAPWGENNATFVVVEATASEDADHARPGHDADNCPFCKRRVAEGKGPVNSLAMIQVVDDQGEVLSGDVRSLLGLKENQIVVARGLAVRDPLGNIILSARGVFVRSPE
jgi:hypothetical protein